MTFSFSSGISRLTRAREHLRRERLVELDEVDVADLESGAGECLARRRDRTGAHHGRVNAGRGAGDDARERLAPQLRGRIGRRDDDAGGAVVDLRRVAGRDGAALAEDRRQLGEALERRVGARALVGVDRVAAVDGDRGDLALEDAGVARRDRRLVRAQREAVLVGARDLVALGHVLGRLAHALGRMALRHTRVDEAPADRRVGDLGNAAGKRAVGLEHHRGRPRHRLDAAGEHEIGVAEADRARRLVDRLEPRGAQPVDGDAGNLDRQAGEQRGHSRDVAVVLAGAVGRAEDDVVDALAGDPIALQRRLDHVRGEVVGTDLRERTAVAPDRRAHHVEDQRVAHQPRS